MSNFDRVSVLADASAAELRAREGFTAPSIAFVVPVGERELRLDLFRGLALWLIFIDHVSPDLLSWFTIRSYGFSDAAEIFIFISGYTAAMVYGRAMLRFGFVIATARILKRVWEIYAAHVLLRLVFSGWCETNSPDCLVASGILGFLCLFVRGILRHADLVLPAACRADPALARAVDVSD